MEQVALVAGKDGSHPGSSPTLDPTTWLPGYAWKKGLPARARVEAHSSCQTLVLLRAFCLELGSSQGPEMDQGSMKGDTSPSLSLGFMQVWHE